MNKMANLMFSGRVAIVTGAGGGKIFTIKIQIRSPN
jgi:hypothetical protein